MRTLDLFGATKPWNADDWTASDDRVRGGSSKSHLTVDEHGIANFTGVLDTETLGGAGFASQRTVTEDYTWDLTGYKGLYLTLGKSNGKKFTIILKDALLPKDPDTGREQSTVSWEYDFSVEKDVEKSYLIVPWPYFKPTYRGKEKKDAKCLDLSDVRRFSIMARSFFDTQKGPFSLQIVSIAAYAHDKGVADVERGTGGYGVEHKGTVLPTVIVGIVTVVALVVLFRRWST